MVSHDVPDVFEISDRVAFMHQGKMRLNGTLAEVKAAQDMTFEQFLAGRSSPDDEAELAEASGTRA